MLHFHKIPSVSAVPQPLVDDCSIDDEVDDDDDISSSLELDWIGGAELHANIILLYFVSERIYKQTGFSSGLVASMANVLASESRTFIKQNRVCLLPAVALCGEWREIALMAKFHLVDSLLRVGFPVEFCGGGAIMSNPRVSQLCIKYSYMYICTIFLCSDSHVRTYNRSTLVKGTMCMEIKSLF